MDTAEGPFASVLVDIELGRDAMRSIPHLVRHALILRGAAGRVTLHAILPEPLFIPDQVSIDTMREQVEQEADRCLRAASDLIPADVSVSMFASRGRRAAAICAALRRGHHDVVVMYGDEQRRGRAGRRLARLRGRVAKTGVPVAFVTAEPASGERTRTRPGTLAAWRRLRHARERDESPTPPVYMPFI
jgi:hypothetical protein